MPLALPQKQQGSLHGCPAPRAQRPSARVNVGAKAALNFLNQSSSTKTAAPLSNVAVTQQTIDDFKTQFATTEYEYEYWVEPAWVEGTLPKELRGTYLRNGPGLQVLNPRHQRHVFDGDGMIRSLAFTGGADSRAFFRNRFVRTKGFVDEQAAGRPLYRNSFTRGSADGSLLFNPFDLNFKNVANTGVLYWGGQLLALWEGGLPHVLDPVTLDTKGDTKLGGSLKDKLAAHYRITTEADGSSRYVTFATDTSVTSGSAVTFFEYGADGRCLHRTSHPVPGVDVLFLHDMLVTEHYYVALIGPVKLDFAKFATQYLLSQASIAECLKYSEDGPSRIMLFPRPGRPDAGTRSASAPLAPLTFETIPFFAFHDANAYETSDGRVVVDTVAWDDLKLDVNQFSLTPEYYVGGSRSELFRLVVDPSKPGSAAQHGRMLTRTVEFTSVAPAVVGKQHRYVYCVADRVNHPVLWGPAEAIAKIEMPPDGRIGPCSEELWSPGDRKFVGEPIFVPRPGGRAEDDGWVIVYLHDASTMKADVAILDARRISAGPVATIHLPHQLSYGLHGSFTPTYLGPDPKEGSMRPTWKEPNRIRVLL